MNEIESVANRSDGVAAYLRNHREAILRDWVAEVRSLPLAGALPREALCGVVPMLLERLASMVEQLLSGRAADVPHPLADRHAMSRLAAGFDLVDVTTELSLLRSVIVRRMDEDGHPCALRELRFLGQAMDCVLAASIGRYAHFRQRTLEALNRVSAESLESKCLDELLSRLARAFGEQTPSVDATAIFLMEGDRLHLRASVGLEDRFCAGLMGRVDESFAARIAEEKRPILLCSAAEHPFVADAAIERRGMRALYGVPLLDADRFLGVAVMGSRNAYDFPEEERQLFESMAVRATAAIHHQIVRDIADERARSIADSEARLRALNDALRASQERLRVAVELTELGTWEWDLTSDETTWSERGKAIFGVRPAEGLDYARFLERLLPEDRGPHRERVQRALDARGTGLFSQDHRIVRADSGEERWVACRARTHFDAQGRPLRMTGAVLDITDRKRGEHRAQCLAEAGKLLASSLDYERTLVHVAEMVVPAIADVCMVDVVGPDRTLGDHVAVAHRDPEKRELLRAMRARFGPARFLVEMLRSGRALILPDVARTLSEAAIDPEQAAMVHRLGLSSALFVPLLGRDEPLGALSLGCTTESGRRFSERDLPFGEELARLASSAIENARLHEATREAVELRDRVLAVVSHDLKSPLTAIDLGAAVLQEMDRVKSDPMIDKQIKMVRRNAGRMSRMIGDLLDMSSIQSGRLRLELSHCSVVTLLLECVEAQAPMAREKGIDLRSEVRLDASSVTRCDRDRIFQVLSNLLGNAIKFCQQGDRVTLIAERRVNDACIRVVDTGPGIPAEDQPHVFELFWKGRAGEKRGIGLGLFIARGIVEAHRGRMWVESTPGRGSSFAFTLPLFDRATGVS